MKYMKMFAQVLLVIICTVFLSVIFSFISPEMGKDFLDSMVAGIPIFNTWIDLLSDYFSFDSANMMNLFIQSFFEAVIMGICMTVCKKITKFFNVTRLIPFGGIIITFVGMVIGFILCSFLENESSIALVALGLIVVYGLLFVVKSILPIHSTLVNIVSMKDSLIIIINSLVAVILTGYIASLFLFVEGAIGFSLLIEMAVVTVISMLILYTVDGYEA